MSISAKTNYACKAVLALSLHWPNETPMRINDIAKQQKIPLKFLTQILLILKQTGCVQSSRGKSGGYLLSKAPKEINLSDVISGFGNFGFATSKYTSENDHVIEKIWGKMDQKINSELNTINFECICQQQKNSNNIVSFEI